MIGPEGRIDRQFYTFCVLERLQDGLRRRDLFVPASRRWGDPHARLLQGSAWEKVRSRVCRTLGRSPTAAPDLEDLGKQLEGLRQFLDFNLPKGITYLVQTTRTLEAYAEVHDVPSMPATPPEAPTA